MTLCTTDYLEYYLTWSRVDRQRHLEHPGGQRHVSRCRSLPS